MREKGEETGKRDEKLRNIGKYKWEWRRKSREGREQKSKEKLTIHSERGKEETATHEEKQQEIKQQREKDGK